MLANVKRNESDMPDNMHLQYDDEPMRLVRDLLTEQGNRPRELTWNGQRLDHNMTWQDVASPVGGDEVMMGQLAMQSAEGHDWSDTPTHLEVRNTAWGDYCGSTCERSNARSLVHDFPDTFIVVTGGYSSEYLALPLDAEIPEHLFDALISLSDDYPVYDEQDMSELESELETECWDSYGRYDLTRGLRDAIGDDADDVIPDDDELDALFYEVRTDLDAYPEFEDAVSCFWPREDDVVDAIVDAIVATWKAKTPPQAETLPLAI